METALRASFRPEFLNRLDATVVFQPLSPEALQHIVRLQLRLALQRVQTGYGITVRATDRAFAALARDGYDPANGARPLKRVIETRIIDPLAQGLLANLYRRGDIIGLDHDGSGYRFSLLDGRRDERDNRGRCREGNRTEEPPRQERPLTDVEKAYKILGLETGTPLYKAEAVYRAMMRHVHPDVGGTDEQARDLNWAIDVLRREAC